MTKFSDNTQSLSNTNKLNYLMFGIPSYGHTAPTLYLVKHLIDTGNTVNYFNIKAFEDMIKSAGAIFHDYSSFSLSNISLAISSLQSYIVVLELQKIFLKSTKEIVEKIPSYNINFLKIDVIIYDQMAFWGYVIAKIKNIPSFFSSTMLLVSYNKYLKNYAPNLAKYIDEEYLQLLEPIKAYTKEIKSYRDIIKIQTGRKSQNVLIYSPIELQPNNYLYRNSKYIFLGNRFSSKYKLDNFKLKNLIYVSLGTVFNEKFELFKVIIDNIFQSLRSYNKHKNIEIHQFVNQLDVLSHTVLFITHAGFNSVYEGLYFAVPMIMIPHNPEQYFNATIIKNINAGEIVYDSNMSQSSILIAIETLLLNLQKYKQAAKRFSKIIMKSLMPAQVSHKINKIILHLKTNQL